MLKYDVEESKATDMIANYMTPTGFVRGDGVKGTFSMLERNGRRVCNVELAECPYIIGLLDNAIAGKRQGPDHMIDPVRISPEKIRAIREDNIEAESILNTRELRDLKDLINTVAYMLIKYGKKTYPEEDPEDRIVESYDCDSESMTEYIMSTVTLTDFLRGTSLEREFKVLDLEDNDVYSVRFGEMDDTGWFVDQCNHYSDYAGDCGLGLSIDIPDAALRKIREEGAEAKDVLSEEEYKEAQAFFEEVIADTFHYADWEWVGHGDD